jgi:hypothetical protein
MSIWSLFLPYSTSHTHYQMRFDEYFRPVASNTEESTYNKGQKFCQSFVLVTKADQKTQTCNSGTYERKWQNFRKEYGGVGLRISL